MDEQRQPEHAGDRYLRPFLEGVAELRNDDEQVVGHVATKVDGQVWLLLTWADGAGERIIEDYQPWTYVAQLHEGFLLWDDLWNRSAEGPPTRFSARWLAGAERAEAWRRYGIHEPVGAYIKRS